MEIRKLTLYVTVAILTFALGVSVFAGARFALSFMPILTMNGNVRDRVANEAEPTRLPAEFALAEAVFDAPTKDQETIEDQAAQEFDPTGGYYLNPESVPKAFSDIHHLEIETREYNYDANDNFINSPIAPRGSIQTTKIMKFTRIAIGSKEITFQTATVDGVSYKFTGRFLTNDYSETEHDTPDIKGRLIKIKDNKWIAEMEAKFYVSGC